MGCLGKGKTADGKWDVRPAIWAGIWDKNGNLVSGNVLFESDSEHACDAYIMNCDIDKIAKTKANELKERINEKTLIDITETLNDEVKEALNKASKNIVFNSTSGKLTALKALIKYTE